MVRYSLPLLFVLSSAIAVFGQGQGYQLKYVPIPPKPKAKEELPADKLPVVRIHDSSPLPTREELQANWQAHNERLQAQFAEADKAEAERKVKFDQWERDHQRAVDAYNAGAAAAAASQQPSVLYVVPIYYNYSPFDPICDYWGIRWRDRPGH